MNQPLLINALNCCNTSRPPIWFMRQAGRYLPEYRQIREKYSFLEMCHTPELAAEITRLPIDLIGFDAAIVFSDILVIPEALGLGLHFEESKGPLFERPLHTKKDIANLPPIQVEESLNYVAETIKNLVADLPVPLIGFSGAPFTLASYMIEGKTSKDFKKTKRWMMADPESFHQLLDKLSDLVIKYLNMQIDAGVQALQIFDSWAWILNDIHFEEFSNFYLKKILDHMKTREVPVIFFCRGSSVFAPVIAKSAPHAISIDWNGNLKYLRQILPKTIALQGNLDPDLFYASSKILQSHVNQILKDMLGDKGFVFNLGHGIKPDTPVDAVKAVVHTVKNAQLDFC
ncbi:Uroporphyrinogen decarboxylase [Chlamydiales bacterium STE3]|nr:Uroporphyrinogen decarboxylase [Chlamydiales bacterium STE3]